MNWWIVRWEVVAIALLCFNIVALAIGALIENDKKSSKTKSNKDESKLMQNEIKRLQNKIEELELYASILERENEKLKRIIVAQSTTTQNSNSE